MSNDYKIPIANSLVTMINNILMLPLIFCVLVVIKLWNEDESEVVNQKIGVDLRVETS